MSSDTRAVPRARSEVPTTGWIAVAVVLVAVAVPVVAVAVRALRPDDAWSLDAVTQILGSARTWRLVALTVGQAAASSAVTVAVGVPVAWVLTRYRFAGRSLVRTVAMVPFVLPTVVVGAAFASLLGPRGLVDARGTWWAIIAAHLCFNLAVVVRTVGAAMATSDPDLEAAARLLGADAPRVFRSVVVPAIAPAVAAAAIVVFLFCLTSFGVIVILGGGSVSTVEVEIWTRATSQFDLSGAGVLCMVQLVAVVATLAVHARIARRAATRGGRGGSGGRPPVLSAVGRRPGSGRQWGVVAGAVAAVLVVSVVPLGALVERSFRVGDRLGLDHWRHLGAATAGTGLRVAPIDALVTSLVAAVIGTAVAVALALPAARAVAARPGSRADRVLLLPLGVSATTIGLGLLLVFGRPPLDLRGSPWIVPLGQMLVALPLAVRSIVPALQSMSPSMGEAASLLGAGPSSRWWRVELPLVRRAVVAGGGLAFVACLGEFGATVFLARTARPTVPIAIERLMSRPGGAGFGQAMALSCVLVVLCAAVLWAVDRWATGDDGLDLAF